MKTIILTPLVICATIAFIGSSCNRNTGPCPEPQRDTVLLSPSVKDVVPYKVNDIIRFKHNNSETWSYKLQSIDSGFNITSENDRECPNLHLSQYISFNLWKSNTTSTKWDIKTVLYFPYISGAARIKFSYINSDIEETTSFIPPPPSVFYKYDSLEVNGFYYKYVIKLSGFSQYDTIYYNRQYGILKIVANNEVLERVP